MNERLNLLRKASDAVVDMYNRGQLPAAEYKRTIVVLAHDLMELGEREDAVAMIERLDGDYIDDTLPTQMDADPAFRIVAVGLGKLLRGTADPVDVDLEQALMTCPKPQGRPC